MRRRVDGGWVSVRMLVDMWVCVIPEVQGLLGCVLVIYEMVGVSEGVSGYVDMCHT